MFTPFWNSFFSNTDFNNIPSFENINLCINHNNNVVEISFKHTISTNVFIYENNCNYWLSLNPETLQQFGKNNIKRHYEFFKKLILFKDHYEFIDDDIEIDSVIAHDIEGINILHNWIRKYKDILNSIDSTKLICELSAGFDTRILTFFWRYIDKTINVYTKNKIEETDTAKYIAKYINDNFPVNINLVTNKSELTGNDYITLSGASIVHGLWVNTTLDDYYDEICNPMKSKKAKHIINDICPFYDKEFIKLKGRFPGDMKLILFNNLCNDQQLNKLTILSNHIKIEWNDDLRKFLAIDQTSNIYYKDIYFI